MTRRAAGTVALVVAGAALFLALRTSGLQRGDEPIRFHPDEAHYAGVAQTLSADDHNPHRFENPPLLTYAVYGVRVVHAAIAGEDASRAWIERGGLFESARWIAAVLGAATAFVVAAATRRLFGAAHAVAAAVIVGLSFLHGRDSHYGVNDVPMVFLVSAALACSARWLVGPSLRWLYAAALLAGLAAATKYNGAAALVLPMTALALRTTPGARARALPHVLGLVAVFAAAFVAGNPFALLAFDEFSTGFVRQYAWWGGRTHFGQSHASAPVLYAEATLALLGWAHLAAAAAGAVFIVMRDRRLAALLLVFPVFYLVGMWSKTLFFWRFALPLLPCLAILAACAWVELARRLAARLSPARPQRGAALALAVLLAAASAEPAAKLIRHDQLLHRAHTWNLARDWVLANVPAGSSLFLEGYAPDYPSLESAYRVYLPREHIDRLEYAGRTPETRGAPPVIEAGGWLLTDARYEASWRLSPKAEYWADFHARLRRSFELVAEFPPGPAGDPQPFVSDTLYSPLVDLWSIERPGHTIRIWRIPPGEWRRAMFPDGFAMETPGAEAEDGRR